MFGAIKHKSILFNDLWDEKYGRVKCWQNLLREGVPELEIGVDGDDVVS